MKIAHLILAHKNPHQLNRLIHTLDHPDFDFYIHIDKKTDDSIFKLITRKINVFFIEKRAKIYWGDWGTIQATLNGFEEIIPKGYDYINVLSGQDFPIKSPDHIYRFFQKNKGLEFITCQSPEGEWGEVLPRIEEYHLINWRIPGRHRLEKVITRLLPARRFPLDYKIVGRANWFSLTTKAASYCISFLKDHPEVLRYFRYCWGADEFIFSTILFNSEFKNLIRDNLVYVDWNGESLGHPKVLSAEDFRALYYSDKLFARKFDLDKDASIFDLLEQSIEKQEKLLAQPYRIDIG